MKQDVWRRSTDVSSLPLLPGPVTLGGLYCAMDLRAVDCVTLITESHLPVDWASDANFRFGTRVRC